MSKRMIALRKTMILLGLGGAFMFPFWGGDVGLGDYGCMRNSDLVTFYQDVGDAGIAAERPDGLVDDPKGVVLTRIRGDGSRWFYPHAEGADDLIQTFWTGLLNNWVGQQFPLDLDTTGPVVQ